LLKTFCLSRVLLVVLYSAHISEQTGSCSSELSSEAGVYDLQDFFIRSLNNNSFACIEHFNKTYQSHTVFHENVNIIKFYLVLLPVLSLMLMKANTLNKPLAREILLPFAPVESAWSVLWKGIVIGVVGCWFQ